MCQNLQDHLQGVRFTTEAAITSINIKKDWFYIACSKCAKKATEEDGMYRCLDHGMQTEPSYRYITLNSGFLKIPTKNSKYLNKIKNILLFHFLKNMQVQF